MTDFSKIQYYDLRWEGLRGRLMPIVGRTDELSRVSRVLKRSMNNNCILVGPAGSGKTALVHGWAAQNFANSDNATQPVVQLSAESFQSLNSSGAVPFGRFKEAIESLPKAVVFIDNFGQLIYNKLGLLHYITTLFKPLLEDFKLQLILVLEDREYKWLVEQQPSFINFFETIHLKNQPADEQLAILKQAAERLKIKNQVAAEQEILELILKLAEKFKTLGQLPLAGINILDESMALSLVRDSKKLEEQDVYRVVADKTGVPKSQLLADDTEFLRTFEQDLNKQIIGQQESIGQIAAIIKRAKLGLKNPQRPLGSFLVLGPSGVGKTETAKVLAQKVFGRKESFFRIDMSEFGEAHTVARLVGAPAGYVGFSEGGGLTNAVLQEPYSLTLLDEIEKANPKIFDVFLQILDDGRLTSGQGETVDFSQTIVMATSNLGVSEIIEGFMLGQDISGEDFLRQNILPVLAKTFRLEFLNRFDAILIFNPLTETDLLEIAKLEIKKIESRMVKHQIKFAIDPQVLAQKIKQFSDPRFGARPVKRFVETTCENLISQKLLN